MPHKIKNCFYENLTFDKMLAAHNRAKNHKTSKNEVIRFEMNLENNITNLLNSIRNKTYHVGEYRSFIITEPKPREIQSLPYRDRIVHQWYVEEFIKPYILPKFIKDTYACIPERGTHHAVDTIQHYMQIKRRNNLDYWILKCDIRKYFYSIDKDILFTLMHKYIRDKELLLFTKKLIYENRENSTIGIPIGNYTSQFFANIYLHELDMFVKHQLHVKHYVRYMDDFILLLDSKEECKTTKKIIEDFLHEHLHLELNDKSRYYPNRMGVNFCGYRIWPTHRLLRTSSKRKIKHKIRKWNKLWRENRLDYDLVIPTLNSWFGHLSHCNSYHFKQKILQKAEFLYDNFEGYKDEL